MFVYGFKVFIPKQSHRLVSFDLHDYYLYSWAVTVIESGWKSSSICRRILAKLPTCNKETLKAMCSLLLKVAFQVSQHCFLHASLSLLPCCCFFFLLPSLSSSLISPLKFQPKTKWYQAGSCEEAECAVQSQTADAWHGAVRVKHEICLHFSPDGSHSFRKWNADGLSCKINSRQGLWSLSIMSSEQRRPCLVDLISFFLIPKIHTDDTPWIHLCKMTWKPFFFSCGCKKVRVL